MRCTEYCNNNIYHYDTFVLKSAVSGIEPLKNRIWHVGRSWPISVLVHEKGNIPNTQEKSIYLYFKGHSGVLGNKVAEQLVRQSTHGSTLNINIEFPKCCLKKNLKKCSLVIWQDRWNLSETGRRNFHFVPQVNINRASFNSRTNQFITGHGPFVTYLHRFGLCSHDRRVCCAKGDRNYYPTVCPGIKPFHFKKLSA
ncbi:hypothetical protein AVEN_28489-1 [Araneus ventricosus]|uniref:RNase H type-1 domain-containing protein n=1 Tax=Araneus ventricosus TaxID=182803 RepID=A0A4Y1ZRJ7_ARAVE|nr:hypothetical protein AVEN_222281-1 [Araneus ventricosus]GBL63479.1 hypothetical protein AVEN_28489-1 [Araneus ventricosus]